MKIDKWVVMEAIDTLYQANITLLRMTALDSQEEMERKRRENETATTRRIKSAIDLLEASIKEE